MTKTTAAIRASRIPMATPIKTRLLPEESDGVVAVVNREQMRAHC